MDRIDTAGVDDAISTINEASGTAPTDDLDIAMGTLMAYSGKFLRQIGAWAFEHATQTSSDTFSQSAVPDKETGKYQYMKRDTFGKVIFIECALRLGKVVSSNVSNPSTLSWVGLMRTTDILTT